MTKQKIGSFIGTATLCLSLLFLGGCPANTEFIENESTQRTVRKAEANEAESVRQEGEERMGSDPLPGETGAAETAEGAESEAGSGEIAGHPREKTIIAMTDASYTPFEFMDARGQPIGFDIDLVKAIAEDQGYRVQFLNRPFPKLFTTLMTSPEVDLLVACITKTDERSELALLSDSYLDLETAITVNKEDSGIDNALDLRGKRISFVSGTIFEDELKRLLGDDFTPVPAESHYFAIRDLLLGKADAMVSDGGVLNLNVHKYADKNLRIFTDNVNLPPKETVIAVNKEKPEMLEVVNKGLKNIKENGTYDLLVRKWLSHM